MFATVPVDPAVQDGFRIEDLFVHFWMTSTRDRTRDFIRDASYTTTTLTTIPTSNIPLRNPLTVFTEKFRSTRMNRPLKLLSGLEWYGEVLIVKCSRRVDREAPVHMTLSEDELVLLVVTQYVRRSTFSNLRLLTLQGCFVQDC